MWRCDDVRLIRNRPVDRRLLLEDVDRRRRNLPRLQRSDECRRLNQLTARGVANPHALLALGEPLGVEQVPGLRRDGQVQREVVGLGAHVVERPELRAQLTGQFSRDERVVRDNLHAKRSRAHRHFLADAPEPDNAERLAAQLDAGELLLLPLVLLHRGVRRRQMPREREHLRQRELCDADAVGARRVHHDDAASGGGVEVDVVDAGAGARDDAQLRRGAITSAVTRVALRTISASASATAVEEFGERTARLGVQLPALDVGEQRDGGSWKIIGNDNFHRERKRGIVGGGVVSSAGSRRNRFKYNLTFRIRRQPPALRHAVVAPGWCKPQTRAI